MPYLNSMQKNSDIIFLLKINAILRPPLWRFAPQRRQMPKRIAFRRKAKAPAGDFKLKLNLCWLISLQ